VMSARPGQVAGIVEVDLKQPRTTETREDPRFFELITTVRETPSAGRIAEPVRASAVEERF
jgi:ABC-type nitrate/sulfonate/bicarbonate transport system ATPase subunit